MPNRLADATSPYLLQHRDNPVDWYEWGEEALARAATENRPILLSVGYASCHWCHVMAHESFEDPATADLMNRWFVNIKVDREERPDVDRIYMDAVQAMTGRGGWPMTVFLTPDGRPFFAGTYFPDEDRHGMPAFRRVLTAVAEAWAERRDEVVGQADHLTRAIARDVPPADDVPGRPVLEQAYRTLVAGHDPVNGGFGGAPKFPQAPTLEFLLRITGEPWAPDARAILHRTLTRMAAGGIYDQLAGGFSRYAVDAVWLVPHFEKMLYDNGQLARIYLRAWQVLGDDDLRRVAVEVLDYLLRDLAGPDGSIFSAEDADSEGVEGKFYAWSDAEFREVVGADDAPVATAVFGVTPGGNFEGANVLSRARSPEEVASAFDMTREEVASTMERAARRLLARRADRIRPGLDDKVVTAWNGLAMRALAEAGAVLGDERYLDAARRNARFVLEHLVGKDGRLLRSWSKGRATVPAFSEDYGSYAVALFTLYQATGETEWFTAGRRFVDEMIELFAAEDGGFYASGSDASDLIARPRDLMDNPSPSGNTLAAEALLLATLLTGDERYRRLLHTALRGAGRLAERYPTAVGHLLAVAHAMHEAKEVAVVGDPGDPATRALTDVLWETFRPECALATGEEGDEAVVPLLAGRRGGSPPLAYVCRDFVCAAPVSDPDALRVQLDGAGSAEEG